MKIRELDGYKYETLENGVWAIDLPDCRGNSYFAFIHKGELITRSNYAWDGSSIPYKKFLRVLSFGLYDADRYCKEASLKHDALCQLMREGYLDRKHKQYIDDLYRRDCIAAGMPVWQANLRYKALRKFGDKYIQPEKKPRGKIIEI